MNVAIYARYSSYSQTEQSIEGQLKVCHEFAEKNNYTVIGEYIDRALTGRNDNRMQFQKMIEDSKKKLFEGVLVYQLDRFSRNRYDSAIYKHKLMKNGVRLFSARENISDDASGILLESVIVGTSEYFSVELSQKVKRGMGINAEKCLYNGGSVTYGYKIDINKKYQIEEEHAGIVKRVFQMYNNNNSMSDIVKYLNNHNIKNSKGREFKNSMIYRILSNRKYLGIYIYNDVEIEGGIPQIIDKETFLNVQKKLEKNKIAPARKKAKMEYLLSTKLFCGKCKEVMTGMCGTSCNSSMYYYYYSCNGKRKGKCDKKNVQKDFIENLVIEQAKQILTDEKIEEISKEVVKFVENEKNNSNINFLEKNLKNVEKEKENLINALKICDNDTIRRSIFDEFEKLEEKKNSIEQEIREEKLNNNFNITYMEVKFFLNHLKNGDVNDLRYRQLIIDVLVNKVYLYDDYILIIFNAIDEKNSIKVPLIEDIESSYLILNGEPK